MKALNLDCIIHGLTGKCHNMYLEFNIQVQSYVPKNIVA